MRWLHKEPNPAILDDAKDPQLLRNLEALGPVQIKLPKESVAQVSVLSWF